MRTSISTEFVQEGALTAAIQTTRVQTARDAAMAVIISFSVVLSLRRIDAAGAAAVFLAAATAAGGSNPACPLSSAGTSTTDPTPSPPPCSAAPATEISTGPTRETPSGCTTSPRSCRRGGRTHASIKDEASSSTTSSSPATCAYESPASTASSTTSGSITESTDTRRPATVPDHAPVIARFHAWAPPTTR